MRHELKVDMVALWECKYCGRHNVAASSRAGMCESCYSRYQEYYRLIKLPPSKMTELKQSRLQRRIQEYRDLAAKGCKLPGCVRLDTVHMT